MTPVKVLIIEDDTPVSKIHAKFLERIEHMSLVGIANCINDGKYMVETLQPDLILLDLFFPEGNGMDLLYELRAEHAKVDVILITAAKDLDHLDKALKGGVFDYMIKPVFFERFQESLASYLGHRSKTDSARQIDQEFIDNLLKGKADNLKDVGFADVPKGIDPITLQDVFKVFDNCPPDGLNATEVGKRTGLARTSARKYCEYLLSIGRLQIKLEYGTIGRPERRYIHLSNQPK